MGSKMMDSVRILGANYSVSYEEDLFDAVGAVHNNTLEIKIRSSRHNPEHQKSVLLHEIIEVLNYRLELDLEHNQITQLETGLFSVLQDNPSLVKLFKSKE